MIYGRRGPRTLFLLMRFCLVGAARLYRIDDIRDQMRFLRMRAQHWDMYIRVIRVRRRSARIKPPKKNSTWVTLALSHLSLRAATALSIGGRAKPEPTGVLVSEVTNER